MNIAFLFFDIILNQFLAYQVNSRIVTFSIRKCIRWLESCVLLYFISSFFYYLLILTYTMTQLNLWKKIHWYAKMHGPWKNIKEFSLITYGHIKFFSVLLNRKNIILKNSGIHTKKLSLMESDMALFWRQASVVTLCEQIMARRITYNTQRRPDLRWSANSLSNLNLFFLSCAFLLSILVLGQG